MAPDPDESDLLDKKATNRIQSTLGTMLYYERSVDTTMMMVINEKFQVQSRSTGDTVEKLENTSRLCRSIPECNPLIQG